MDRYRRAAEEICATCGFQCGDGQSRGGEIDALYRDAQRGALTDGVQGGGIGTNRASWGGPLSVATGTYFVASGTRCFGALS